MERERLIELLNQQESHLPDFCRGPWKEGTRLLWGICFSVPFCYVNENTIEQQFQGMRLKYMMDMADEHLPYPYPILWRNIRTVLKNEEFQVTYLTVVPSRVGVWNCQPPTELLPLFPIGDRGG
jgi:hypothetical protein